MRPVPERAHRGRRLLLLALALSLLVHVFGGGVLGWLARVLPHAPPPHDDVAVAQHIEIEKPSPTPRPTATPTPAPTPTPKPALAGAAAVPRHGVQPRVRIAPRPVPPPPPAAHHEISVAKPHARAQPPITARGAYSTAQLAALDAQFRSTIASAQRAAAASPAPAGAADNGTSPYMKRYNAIMRGSPADFESAAGTCTRPEPDVRGAYAYVYWTCTIRYSDGWPETVAFPWPFVYPRDRVPGPGQRFPEQGPPGDWHAPALLPVSRTVCFYFRAQCDKQLAKTREAEASYGLSP